MGRMTLVYSFCIREIVCFENAAFRRSRVEWSTSQSTGFKVCLIHGSNSVDPKELCFVWPIFRVIQNPALRVTCVLLTVHIGCVTFRPAEVTRGGVQNGNDWVG